ncbi:hypothetical protein K2Z84_13880 [Candidatus Binatia bacterium]|nr:hypothetical protein [Candidatus Binatia bacterium]
MIAAGVTSTDSVTDNFLTGYDYPIVTSSTQPIDVLRNVINTSATLYPITLGSGVTSVYGNVKRNVFFGGATSLFLVGGSTTDHVIYEGNYCDPNESSCSACLSQGRCQPYTSPFLGN